MSLFFDSAASVALLKMHLAEDERMRGCFGRAGWVCWVLLPLLGNPFHACPLPSVSFPWQSLPFGRFVWPNITSHHFPGQISEGDSHTKGLKGCLHNNFYWLFLFVLNNLPFVANNAAKYAGNSYYNRKTKDTHSAKTKFPIKTHAQLLMRESWQILSLRIFPSRQRVFRTLANWIS